MNVLRITRSCMLTTLVALGTTLGLNRQNAAQEAPAAGQDGVEVLTRGPVHEAFAETITFDPEPGIVAPQAPPADIEELPPDQRPAGANVAWIPGYWAWDDERNDFLWVSGIWRSLPPGRQWVPGYWAESQQGSQWTSGYWADAAANEITYLPQPPATVESGPNIAAPSANHTWLPGCWIWHQNRYVWRAGYWTQGNQNWDWVPDHYVWTPSGYVFVDGYYDYSVPRRGIVFAPVYFNGGLRTQRGFSYSPSTVINPRVFVNHLFLRPGYGHYYFGDYYGANYADAGFSPWFSYQSSRRGYDPIYANQRWQHRNDRDWEHRVEANFRNYRDNENTRPPRTWAAQRERAKRTDETNRKNATLAASLDELAQRKNGRQRFQPVDPTERQQFGLRGQEYRKYLQQRQQLEANAARTQDGDPAIAVEPARRKFSRSPIMGPPADQLGKDDAPPQRHQVLKPDLKVQPQSRVRTTQGNRRGASAGQSQDQRANRGQARGASDGQSQDAQGQAKNRSKKKGKD